MMKYIETRAGVECRESTGGTVVVSLFIKGFMSTRTNGDGSTETYEPYAELIDSGVEIEWLSDDAKDKAAKVVEVQAFKAGRKAGVSDASVTVGTGKVFSADETSITRMHESKQAIESAVELGLISEVSEYPLQWVLHDAESGEGVEITYDELVEAFVLANQNRAALWLKK
jgi:hypothetical protein